MIRFSEVSYWHADEKVFCLQDIILEIPKGKFVAIIGQNGSGKTTVLKLAAKIIKPRKGQVIYNETYTSSDKVQIGYIPQKLGLIKHLSVSENLELGYLGVSNPRDENKKWIAFLEINEMLNKKISALSGGEQQRISICRALLREPNILIGDEITSNLDISKEMFVLQLLQNLSRSDQVTVLVSLHSPELAMRISDRIIGMRSGKIVFHNKTNQVSKADIKMLYD
jgi:ABC-type multidrug transport system ATPase subunit